MAISYFDRLVCWIRALWHVHLRVFGVLSSFMPAPLLPLIYLAFDNQCAVSVSVRVSTLGALSDPHDNHGPHACLQASFGLFHFHSLACPPFDPILFITVMAQHHGRGICIIVSGCPPLYLLLAK